MIATVLGSIAARFVGTAAVRCFGFRPTLIVMGVCAAVMTAVPALFRVDTPVATIASVLAVMGFARATFFVAASALTFADVAAEQISRASTLSTVIQQLGLSLGISIAGAALVWATPASGHLTITTFVAPFLVFGVAALVTVPAFARLAPGAGEHMRGQRRAVH